MTSRTTAALALVTALLAIYVFAIERRIDPRRDFSAVPVAKAAEISAIEISGAAGEIALARAAGGGWRMTAPLEDRADATEVDELVNTLLELKKLQTADGEDWPGAGEMGLGDTALKITLHGEGDRRIGTLALGDSTGVQGTVYARWEDGTPFLCWADLRLSADVSADALRDIRLLAVPVERMRRVKFKQDDTPASLVIDRASPEAPWLITKPLKTGASPNAVDTRLSLIANMAAEGFIDNPNGDVAAAFAGESKTISVWRHGERGAIELQMARSPGGEAAFARASNRPGVFSIDPGFLDAMSLNPNGLRDRRLAPFNPNSVLAVEIDAKPDRHVSLLQGERGWEIVEGQGGIPANRQYISKMLKTLAAEEVEEFVADAVGDLKVYGLDDPTLTLTLKMLAQDPQEPSNDDGSPNLTSTTLTILVKRFQPDNQPAQKLYATVEGSGTVVELGNTFPSIVSARSLSYRSLYLWPSFNLPSLREVEISRPPRHVPLKLEYLEHTNTWTGELAGEDVTKRIDAAAALKVAQQLGLPLAATRWIDRDTEGVQEALAEPVLNIAFSLENAGQRFDFGIDIAPVNRAVQGGLFYARVHGSNAVCIIDRPTFNALDLPLLKPEPEPPAPPAPPAK